MARPSTNSRPRTRGPSAPASLPASQRGARGGRKTPAELAAEQAARETAHARELVDVLAAVDDWFAGDEPSMQIDLSDGSQAAVDAVASRAVELGAVTSRLPGRRIVLQVVRAASPARVY